MAKQLPQRRILVGVSGASGSVYADMLLKELLDRVERVYVVATETGLSVVGHELPASSLLARTLQGTLTDHEKSVIRSFAADNLYAPPASGSSVPTDMVVIPCSMGSVARMAHGISSNLLERSADVILKHRRPLIVCPRETPLNLIHLRSLTALAEAGAQILPLMPAFYQRPESVEDLVSFCVGRVLEQLGFEHDLYGRWNSRLV